MHRPLALVWASHRWLCFRRVGLASIHARTASGDLGKREDWHRQALACVKAEEEQITKLMTRDRAEPRFDE